MTARMPKVGIIISNFNYAAYIEECLASIFAQTYANIDVVVVDDCSTDNSLAVLRVAAAANTFRLLVNETNSGQSQSLRAGLKLLDPSIAFVQFIDADDTLRPDAVENLVKGMLWAGTRAGVVGGRVAVIDAHGTLLADPRPERRFDVELVSPGQVHIQHWPIACPTSAMIFRRALAEPILDNIAEDELRISTDMALASIAYLQFGLAKINSTVLNYRMHGRNNWLADISYDGYVCGLPTHETNWKHVASVGRRIVATKTGTKGPGILIGSYSCSENEFLQRWPSYSKLKRAIGGRITKTSVRNKRIFVLKRLLRLGSRRRNIFGNPVHV